MCIRDSARPCLRHAGGERARAGLHELRADGWRRAGTGACAVPAEPPGVRDGCAACLLYTSDAADERSSVDLGGRRIIKKKTHTHNTHTTHTTDESLSIQPTLRTRRP